MASSGIQYGTTNPRGMDPWPIEQTLAPLAAAGSSANAQRMLGDYQTQREIAGNVYGQDLEQQHAFAYQQLQQQMQENYIKAAMEAVKTRGGISALNAVAPGALANLDPSVASGIEGGLTSLQNAQILKDAGAGAYSAVEAGRGPTDAQAYAASGGLLGPQGTPLQLQIAREKEAAANARHTADASAAAAPNITETVMSPFGQRNISFPGKKFGAPGSVDAYLDAAGVPRINAGNTGSPPLPPEAQALAPPPPGRGTSLPQNPAQPAARPAAPPKTPAPNNTVVSVPQYQAAVAANIENYKSAPWYADVKAGMAANHGLAIVKPGANGPELYGSSGRRAN
jgi:hypothetical protein